MLQDLGCSCADLWIQRWLHDGCWSWDVEEEIEDWVSEINDNAKGQPRWHCIYIYLRITEIPIVYRYRASKTSERMWHSYTEQTMDVTYSSKARWMSAWICVSEARSCWACHIHSSRKYTWHSYIQQTMGITCSSKARRTSAWICASEAQSCWACNTHSSLGVRMPQYIDDICVYLCTVHFIEFIE